MVIQLVVCSEGTSVDKFTSKLSIFNVVDRYGSLTFPLWIPELSLTLALKREAGDSETIVGKLQGHLGDSQIAETDIFLEFQTDGIARAVITLQLAIPAPGDVVFSLVIGEEQRIKIYTLPVTQLNPQSAE